MRETLGLISSAWLVKHSAHGQPGVLADNKPETVSIPRTREACGLSFHAESIRRVPGFPHPADLMWLGGGSPLELVESQPFGVPASCGSGGVSSQQMNLCRNLLATCRSVLSRAVGAWLRDFLDACAGSRSFPIQKKEIS
jgi:hypothetical protein